MAVTYESGAYLTATWTVDGGASKTIKILNNKAVEKVTELVKKMAGNSALPERYAGFGDFETTFTALVDSSLLPSASSMGFRAGNKGTIKFPVGTTALAPSNWFIAHCMVLEVSYDNPVDDLLSYNVKLALDISSGSFTYPT